MIGLLRKDLFVADRSSRLLVVLALVFSLTPSLGNLGSTYAMMMAFMLPINSIAYDERSKWDRYAAMLPYKTSQIVWSKYVLSFIYMLLGETIILLGTCIRNIIRPDSADWIETMEICAMLAVVMLLVAAVALPALYRFGSEKGRLVMIVMMGVGVGIALALRKLVPDTFVMPSLPTLAVVAAAVAATVLAIWVSFRLSVKFYKNRQNGKYNS